MKKYLVGSIALVLLRSASSEASDTLFVCPTEAAKSLPGLEKADLHPLSPLPLKALSYVRNRASVNPTAAHLIELIQSDKRLVDLYWHHEEIERLDLTGFADHCVRIPLYQLEVGHNDIIDP